MSISSRIHDTLEQWQAEWKDRLRGWMASWVSWGFERFFDLIEPLLAEVSREQLDELALLPELPDSLKAVLNRVTKPKGIAPALILVPLAVTLVVTPIMTALTPIFKKLGFASDKIAESYRLDPGSIITAWRRDKVKYEGLFNDLREQGWTEERIEAFKFLTLFMPTASDIVSWYAKEVYEPEMVTKYGLDSELPVYEQTDFPKIGVDAEQAKNYWRAHWVHASWMQIVEMLHRELITEQDVYEWFRLVEIPPYWRELLTKTAYTWPTRVDVRRWWDMRTISPERLRTLYEGMGYRGENLEDYIKWTMVYVDFPMMMTRFKNGWIAEDDIRTWLKGLEIPEERITQFIQEKTKPEAPARVEKERTATATEIMKAVKKEYIAWSEGIERLERMGYSESEAEFKLRVYIGVEAGSPDTYMELVDWTERYRQAIGLDAKIPPPELIEVEKALKEAEATLKEAEEKKGKGKANTELYKVVSDTAYRYRQLLLKWKEEKA